MENINVGERLLKELQEERKELRISAILTFITGIGLLAGVFFQFTEASVQYVWGAFLIAYLAGGFVATIDAIKNLWEKKLDINVLMILAALAAAGVGEVRDGAILLFLFSLAGTLEGYAMGNTKRAVVALMQLRPDEANLLNSDNTTSRVAVEKLLIDQRVVVRPGERMPVDGVIESGLGAIDESSITGESVPVDKSPGDKVFAGSVNQNAVLVVRVTKLANQSTIARMIDLVTKAQEERSPSERFSDWFGERYTIVVLLGSFLALIIFLLLDMSQAEAFYKAATLLVVASPCAIVISVPAAILSALASAARTGVLFKGGAALEDFGAVKTIAFDKTGTLTEGKMEVTDVIGIYTSKEMVLEIANALETHSEHPLARSIQNYARSLKVVVKEASSVRAIPGKGIVAEIDHVSYWAGNRALLAELGVVVDHTVLATLEKLEQEGKTTILVGTEAKILGVIGIADKIRESAVKALAMLKKQGVERFVMLTGDTKLVANAVGHKLGLAEADIYGALLPEDKVNLVKELRLKNNIAFVGDGVNDAAALATSNVGVAMGVAGTDVAIEAADVALLSDDLERLAYTHSLSQKANQIIKQNLIFAVGIMVLMVVTTVFWYLPLPLGVIGHEGGTLLVVANGLRLLFMSK